MIYVRKAALHFVEQFFVSEKNIIVIISWMANLNIHQNQILFFVFSYALILEVTIPTQG